MFVKPPKKVIYCYGGQWQPIFDAIEKEHDVDFIQGIPEGDIGQLFQLRGLILTGSYHFG